MNWKRTITAIRTAAPTTDDATIVVVLSAQTQPVIIIVFSQQREHWFGMFWSATRLSLNLDLKRIYSLRLSLNTDWSDMPPATLKYWSYEYTTAYKLYKYINYINYINTSIIIIIMPPPLGGGIKQWCCLTSVCRLTSVCLSVAYIGPNSRTERSRKTNIGTKIAHVTPTPLSRSKGQRSTSQGAEAYCSGLPPTAYYYYF